MTDEKKPGESWTEVEYHEFPDEKVDFDKTPEVVGTILWRETVPTTGLDGGERMATMYALQTDDGSTLGVWGSANLDPQLAKIADGTRVKIIFTELRKLSGARTMRKFRILTAS